MCEGELLTTKLLFAFFVASREPIRVTLTWTPTLLTPHSHT
jgi:hypothetical protein